MILFSDLTGLLSGAIALTALGVMLTPARLSHRQRRWIGTGLLLVLLTPWQGAPLAIHIRGMVGDLSMASMVLLLPVVTLTGPRNWQGTLDALMKSKLPLLIFIALLALLFYPMSLGISMFDPYQLGYGTLSLIAALSVMAAVALWMLWHLIAVVVILALLTWSVGWYESANLWDYLIDPVAAIYAFGALVKRIALPGWSKLSRAIKKS